MHTDDLNESSILASWQANSGPWTTAVRERQIESRRLATDRAIIDAIVARAPRSLLDIGCGEGWLARAAAAALQPASVDVLGIDAVPELIQQAQREGGGEFVVASYDDVVAGRLRATVDAAVCNFSLLGSASVEALLAALPGLLDVGGAVIVQTLHPLTVDGGQPYRSGWRAGSWAGFSEGFRDPAPWYFRTIEEWVSLHRRCGLQIVEIREPLHPATQRPASILFVSEPSRQSASVSAGATAAPTR